MMLAEPEMLEAKFGEILGSGTVRIEIVLMKCMTFEPLPLSLAADDKSATEEHGRRKQVGRQ